MALTDYERYQLEWMIEHGHSLGELVDELTVFQNDLEAAPGVNLSVSDVFYTWMRERAFGGEAFACEAEWRDAEGKELRAGDAPSSHGKLSESVRNWYMEAYPDDGLGASIDPQLTFARALNAVSLGNGFYTALGVGDSLARERIFQELSGRTGIGYDGIYDAWIDEKPVYSITKDMVRDGIEHGVIRFEANPDPIDPWKTMCCIGEDGGLFYFTDTTDIPVSKYIRMNRNNLDMVVDDVWEALNGDILRDFADDYERYASILSEPHEGGTSSLSLPENIMDLQAVGVGCCFNLFDTALLIGADINLKETGTVVTVDGKDYPLMKGATYEDSCVVDALLDSHGEKRIADYRKQPQGLSLKQAAREARTASDALTETNKTSDTPDGKGEHER